MAPPSKALQGLKKRLEYQWVKIIQRGVGADRVRVEVGQDLTIVVEWTRCGKYDTMRYVVPGTDVCDGRVLRKACEYGQQALLAALRYKGI